MLEMIARGFETRSAYAGDMLVRGRLFREQRAAEGKSIPPEKQIAAHWDAFLHVRKNGRRRYEQTFSDMNGLKTVRMQDNKRIVELDANILKLKPLKDEDPTWASSTADYSDFLEVRPTRGYHDVAAGMRTFLEEVKTGALANAGIRLKVDAGADGIFTIALTSKSYNTEIKIDGNKDFNLVALTCSENYGTGKYWQETAQKLEYEQDPRTGRWFIRTAEISGVEKDVHFTRRMMVDEIQIGDVAYPDELLDVAGLNIPADMQTVDYHFSPPLSYRRKAPDVLSKTLDGLLDQELRPEQIAIVKDQQVLVSDHHDYINYNDARTPRRGSMMYWFVIAATICVLLVLGGALSRRRILR